MGFQLFLEGRGLLLINFSFASGFALYPTSLSGRSIAV